MSGSCSSCGESCDIGGVWYGLQVDMVWVMGGYGMGYGLVWYGLRIDMVWVWYGLRIDVVVWIMCKFVKVCVSCFISHFYLQFLIYFQFSLWVSSKSFLHFILIYFHFWLFALVMNLVLLVPLCDYMKYIRIFCNVNE